MADKKSLFVFDGSNTANQEINTINLTDDSITLICSGLSAMYGKAEPWMKSQIINFLESADGEKFYLLDLD